MCEVVGASDRWAREKVAEAMEEMGDECHLVIRELLRDGNAACRAFAAEVAVSFKGGRRAEGRAEKPLGEPGNPMSEGQIHDKYLECVGSIIDPEVARRTLEMLRGLESLGDVNELVRAYRP